MNNIRNAFAKAKQAAGGAASAAGAAGAGPDVNNAVKGLASLIQGLAVLGGISYAAYNSVVTIQPGHEAIIYNRFGGLNENRTLKEGINFVIPWFQRITIFDVRTRPHLVNTQSGSKDLQMVQISLRVLVKPNPNALAFIFRRLGNDYEERVLPSIVNEVTKAVVAQYNASELLTKRDIVSKQIGEMLTRRSSDFQILLDDVSITHLAFSKEYTAAVEAKQVAQQDSERAKYIVDRAIQEKRTIIIKAEGEARSAELIGKAISSNPAFLQLRRIEVSKDIASTISGANSKIYLNSDTLLLNTLGESTNISTNASATTATTANNNTQKKFW